MTKGKEITAVNLTTSPPTLHFSDGEVGCVALPWYTPRMTKAEIRAKLTSGEAPTYLAVLRNGLITVAEVRLDDLTHEDIALPGPHVYLHDFLLEDGDWEADGTFLGFMDDDEEGEEAGKYLDAADAEAEEAELAAADLDEDPQPDADDDDEISPLDIVYVANVTQAFQLVPIPYEVQHALAQEPQYAADTLAIAKEYAKAWEDTGLSVTR
jgi:hypothetical protein